MTSAEWFHPPYYTHMGILGSEIVNVLSLYVIIFLFGLFDKFLVWVWNDHDQLYSLLLFSINQTNDFMPTVPEAFP